MRFGGAAAVPALAEVQPLEAIGHLIFVPAARGYGLEERSGAAPRRGARLELGERGSFVVNRVGSSPLPRDERDCAYLIRPPRAPR